MLNNVSGNVIFYVPVQRNYLSRWEYYRVDKRMLEETLLKSLSPQTSGNSLKL